jgi:hypothetical protein
LFTAGAVTVRGFLGWLSCDAAARKFANGGPSADLSAPRVLVLAAALLALSEAAIVLVESAGKIQTRMFRGPRTCRGHCSA